MPVHCRNAIIKHIVIIMEHKTHDVRGMGLGLDAGVGVAVQSLMGRKLGQSVSCALASAWVRARGR